MGCWEKLENHRGSDRCFEGFPVLRKIGDIPTLKVIERYFGPCIERLEVLQVRIFFVYKLHT